MSKASNTARVAELERVLQQIAEWIEREFREGDKEYQLALLARRVL